MKNQQREIIIGAWLVPPEEPNKVMDSDLALAIADEVLKLIELKEDDGCPVCGTYEGDSRSFTRP